MRQAQKTPSITAIKSRCVFATIVQHQMYALCHVVVLFTHVVVAETLHNAHTNACRHGNKQLRYI